jgi:hypothetical protein
MPTLQKLITDKFLSKLERSPDFDAEKIAQLKQLMESDKKAKGDDFVKIFSQPDGGELQ